MKKAGVTGLELAGVGLEPTTCASQDSSQSIEQQSLDGGSTNGQIPQKTKYVTKSALKTTLSPELEALIERWDMLADHRRRAILDLAGLGDGA